MVLTGFIPESESVVGHVYRLRSRNLSFGVYVGGRQFIGVRQKFDREYLDAEYHFGEPGDVSGTAVPLEDLGPLPDGIVGALYLGTYDSVTGRSIRYERSIPNPNAGCEDAVGWWVFADTGGVCPKHPGCLAYDVENTPLLKFLKALR